MELVFNAEALRPPITGVGVYSYHLLRELLQSEDIARVHCFSGTDWLAAADAVETARHNMTAEKREQGALEALVQNLRTIIGYVPGSKALYDKVMDRRFRQYADSLAGAVYHETNYLLKPCALPAVITVHDLSHLKYPEFHKPDLVATMNRRLEASVARCAHIITPSELVRAEVLENFNIDPSRVTAIYHGVEESYRPRDAGECAAVLQSLRLDYKRYVLVSATLEPRKGLDTLLEAWAMLPQELRRAYPLVLTGSSGWRNDALKKKMQPFLDDGTLLHLGYVDARILPDVFAGATLFAYPSVYEGFGLPALDAMASGVPVICRAGTSVAEFAEGDCLLMEEGSGEELATTLAALLQAPEEQAAWAQRGLTRAAQFNWQRCAAQTAAVYDAVR